MVWIIGDPQDGVILPYGGPQSVRKRVARKIEAQTILANFGLPSDLGPDLFEIQIKGIIGPPALIEKLWGIVKNPEQDSVPLTVINEPQFEMYNNTQVVFSKVDIGQNGPQFDAETGDIVQDYDITFIEFAEASAIGNGDVAEPELDEPGIGFGGFEEFGEFITKDILGTLLPGFFG